MPSKPAGYHTLTPFFQVDDAAGFVEYVRKVFDARETEMMRMPDGRITHAEFEIGDSKVMVGQGDTMPIALYAYLEDVDDAYNKALQAGGESSEAPNDKFWGDRQGAVKDRWGNMWFLATHKEDVPMDELQRRMATARA
jgi:PhnB protein